MKGGNGVLLERFLPRTEFTSYEDFKLNYKVNVPKDFNFAFDVVDAWAELDPEKKALVWCDDHGGEETFTFSDLSRMSSQGAHFFRSLGIGKGDVVMLILRRRWEYWVAAMALCKLGAIFVPGTMQLTAKDITYRANQAGVKAIVCVTDPFVMQQVGQALPACESVENVVTAGARREGYLYFNEEIEKFPETFPRPAGEEATHARDTMFLYFTSGTTGMPKMVRHNYAHPLGQIITAKYWQCVQDGKLHMSVSDSGWAKFGWGKIYGQWIAGAVIFAYDMDKFEAKKLLEKLEKYKVTTFCAPPTMLRFMLLEDMKSFDLSSLAHCCIAGEPLNPEVFHQWEEVTGLKLYEGFGQSESIVLIANFPWMTPKPGSTGKPSPLYNIELINAKGECCEDGEEGEIVVLDIDKRHPTGLFTGYYRDEKLTEEAMGKGYYNTGDVAWRDSDGYYWFVGRNDDVIKCSGYRIGPFEVESALIEHPAVVECAVTAAPDPTRGQVVKATVVLRKEYSPSEELIKELQEHVKKTTAPYKYPRIIVFVEELPKTISGKIKRKELRENDQNASEAGG
ncbi:AMP-binding protein [Ruminococcaceae bacterium OttesenSCG-928-I18]|nr:AMP-binding protein [Ruminococcaceae bacterium OttesenSCG-928-I18]